VSEESGFEIAKAWVAVSPDASDFAAALDEQLGGISIAVMVTPDASDFASALDEQVGGLSASVAVTPDTSDFASAVDEQTGGLTASVTLLVDPEGASDFGDAVSEQAGTVAIPVTAVPDVTDFADMLGEETAGTVVPVSVVPDVSDFADALGEQVGDLTVKVGVEPDAADFAEAALSTAGLSALPVPVVPDPKSLANFGSALEEGVSGVSEVSVPVVPDRKSLASFGTAVEQGLTGVAVTVEVTPGMGDFADAVQEQAYGLDVTVPVTADTSDAVESLQELQAAEDSAAASASQLSAIGDAAEADDSRIQTLYNGILSIGPAATQAEMEAVDALGGIREAANSISVGDAASQIEEIGPAAQGAASEVTSSLGEAEGSIQTFLSGIYSLGPAATEAEGQIADAMGNARQAIADEASALGSVDYSAATQGLSNVDGAAASLAEDAPAAADASKGLSGVLGELAGRLSYFAVDPFMWMYAAPMVISGVSSAIQYLSNSSDSLVTSLQKQDDATGYNISGYEKLVGQLGQVSAQQDTLAQQVVKVAGASREGESDIARYTVAADGASTAQLQFAGAANNLGDHLDVLQSTYGLTATQAEELASAAGVTSAQLNGGGAAAEAAMAKIEAYANANLSATGAVGQLTTDAILFGDSALTVAARVSGLNDSFSSLVGNQVQVQQSMLGVREDLQAVQADATVAGASMTGTGTASESMQAAFLATIPAIQSTADAMINAKDSSAQVISYVNEQITALSGLTGGSATAAAEVQHLRQWEDNLGLSVDTASASILKSASDLQDSFITQLEAAGAKSQATKTDVSNLADSILATGTQSVATEADRAQLIKDLENAGLTAQKATTLVDGFIRSIQNIPSSKTVSIIETASGTITINEATQTATTQGPGGNASFHGASGGPVYGGSGRPRADDIHAMLSHGEYVVQAPAVHKYGSDLLDSINHMHFAEGGPVGYADGGYAGGLSGLSAWAGMQYQSLQSGFTAQMEALLEAAVAAGKSGGASGRAPIIVNFNGTQMPTPEQTHALMTQLSAAVGVS
jgi:hypothetical protein